MKDDTDYVSPILPDWLLPFLTLRQLIKEKIKREFLK